MEAFKLHGLGTIFFGFNEVRRFLTDVSQKHIAMCWHFCHEISLSQIICSNKDNIF